MLNHTLFKLLVKTSFDVEFISRLLCFRIPQRFDYTWDRWVQRLNKTSVSISSLKNSVILRYIQVVRSHQKKSFWSQYMKKCRKRDLGIEQKTAIKYLLHWVFDSLINVLRRKIHGYWFLCVPREPVVYFILTFISLLKWDDFFPLLFSPLFI